VNVDWENTWTNQVRDIQPNFLISVWKIFCEFDKDIAQLLQGYPIQASLQISQIPSHIPNHPYPNVKVLIIQQIQDILPTINQKIEAEKTNTGRYPDFVICPEHSFNSGKANLENPVLKKLSEVAKHYSLYVIAGTINETEKEKVYISTVTIGPAGDILGVYRKRFPMAVSYTAGNEPAVYESKFGKFAVMICFDAENQVCLDDTLIQRPFMIFNPTWIPLVTTLMDVKEINQNFMQWKIAVDLMRRNFERLAWRHNFTLVRADVPYPGAMGSSQTIGPYSSHVTHSIFANDFCVYIDLTNNQFVGLNCSLQDRTSKEDNTGNRYTVNTMKSPNITAVEFVGLPAKPSNGQFLTSDNLGNIKLWHVSRTSPFLDVPNEVKDSVKRFISLEKSLSFACSFQTKNVLAIYRTEDNSKYQLIETPFNFDFLVYLSHVNIIAGIGNKGDLFAIDETSSEKLFSLKIGEDMKVIHVVKILGKGIILESSGKLVFIEINRDGIKILHEVISDLAITCIGNSKRSDFFYIGGENGTVVGLTITPENRIEEKLRFNINSNKIISIHAVNDHYIIIGSITGTLIIYDISNLRNHHIFYSDLKSLDSSKYDDHSILALNQKDGIMKLWQFQQNQHSIGLTDMMKNDLQL